MLAENAVVIITPTGFNYYGSCSATQPPSTGPERTIRMLGDESDAGTTDAGTDTTMCGTKPVEQLPPVEGGEGGHDWLLDWTRFMDMVRGLSGTISNPQFPATTVTPAPAKG
jgi:hypothetical protein